MPKTSEATTFAGIILRNKHTSNGSYVLWLPSWYPEPLDPYNGDFIQRHARAVSQNLPIHVLYVVKDPDGTITRSEKVNTSTTNKLTETIIHYHVGGTGLVSRLLSAYKWMKIYKREVRKLLQEKGQPQLVHVYIAWRAGLIGLWIKKVWKIPYMITEQWGGYCEKSMPDFNSHPLEIRLMIKKVFQRAEKVSVVSSYLGDRLKQFFSIPDFTVIPNVVNTDIFFPDVEKKATNNRFIHVSTLSYQKDTINIVKAFYIVKKTKRDFCLELIGPVNAELQNYCAKLELIEHVIFSGEFPQPEIAKRIRTSDALILYSRYETFGCVLIEAHACGVPVIVSDIPVLHENVEEGFNGKFAKGEDADALAGVILDFMNQSTVFDPVAISKRAKDRYNYKLVADMFQKWYSMNKSLN